MTTKFEVLDVEGPDCANVDGERVRALLPALQSPGWPS
jgi:hypothetical protein